jgi:hypothetical protein
MADDDSMPPVFTLAFLEGGLRTLAQVRPNLLVFRRHGDGRVTVDTFPDEADVCDALVARLDQRLARIERGRLYIKAANGEAVYVPVGESPLRHCRRYGRLYLRLADGR